MTGGPGGYAHSWVSRDGVGSLKVPRSNLEVDYPLRPFSFSFKPQCSCYVLYICFLTPIILMGEAILFHSLLIHFMWLPWDTHFTDYCALYCQYYLIRFSTRINMFSVHMYVWRSADNSKQFVFSHRHVESACQTQLAQHGSMLAHLTGPEM